MRGEWRKWLAVSLFMLAIGSIVVGLQTSVGNETIYAAKWENMALFYPSLLFHGVLFVPAFIGLRERERFVRVSIVFAIGILILLAHLSFFEEVRAQTMVTVLLPASLLAARDLLERRMVAQAARA